MSSYLESADTDDEQEVNSSTFSEEQIITAKDAAAALKGEGNDAFSSGNLDLAVEKYTEALNALKKVGLPKDPIILLNRSASYLGLKRYVPALNDANQAAEIDATNWKAHWRKGVALMSMSKRIFRTKQAIAAFESCLSCGTLPENKKAEAESELQKARQRFAQQEAEV
jgi:tetratricopeptide (TPR) repeat protein